jgi:hypothetical protein
MKITKSQTKLTAIRSDRLNLHLRPIQSPFTDASSLNSLPEMTHAEVGTDGATAQLVFPVVGALFTSAPE